MSDAPPRRLRLTDREAGMIKAERMQWSRLIANSVTREDRAAQCGIRHEVAYSADFHKRDVREGVRATKCNSLSDVRSEVRA